MIYSEEQVKEIIRQHKTPSKLITKSREYSRELKALINGKEFDKLLVKIEGIEGTEKAEIRRKYSRSIKDFNLRLLRPIDNVYIATGGVRSYELSDSTKKLVLSKLSKIRDSKSLEQWLKDYWINLYHTDPNGLIFLEYKDQNVYPTYKSIETIRAYQNNGQLLDWLLFEKEGDYIRFVDSKTDWTFKVDGDSLAVVEDKTFEHPFGMVPAIINSNKYSIEDKIYLSPFDEIIELEKEYLRDQSIKTVYKFMHGFPIFWKYIQVCKECAGIGSINGETCKVCGGYGYMKRKDVSDTVFLPTPDTDGAKLAPDIAGFISPDLETWNKFNEELLLLEKFAQDAIWGTHLEKQNNETATGKFIDTQPIVNKLNVYADIAEWVEWQLSEWIINFYDQSKPKDKSAATVLYGRRYMIETPDELILRYNDLKAKQAPVTVLDRYMIEYITAKYKNDPESLRLNLIKFKLEPYPHYTLEQVEKFGSDELQEKYEFGEWWMSLDESYILSKPIEQLEQEYETYLLTKEKENDNESM
jgi:hypothetical protein